MGTAATAVPTHEQFMPARVLYPWKEEFVCSQSDRTMPQYSGGGCRWGGPFPRHPILYAPRAALTGRVAGFAAFVRVGKDDAQPAVD